MSEKNCKILLIDDDKFLLDMYSVRFRQEDFDVEISLGAVEALEKIKEGALYDIVLVDILMPAMDGFSFLQTVKEEKLLPRSKMVVLSNLGQKEDLEKAKNLGAVDYIVKAYFTPSEIVKKINEILGK